MIKITDRQLFILLVISIPSLLLLFSCGTGPEDEGLNPNIVLIKDCCVIGEPVTGNIIYGHFKNSNQIIYIGELFGVLDIGPSFTVENDSIFPPVNQVQGVKATYMSDITSSNSFLVTLSSFSDVSTGRLYEYNIELNQFSLLKDSLFNISTAVYWPGKDTRLVYYSYGNEDGLEAGYYLHDKIADTDSLLLAHRSEIGPSEMLNGFDLSPDGTKLLYPNIRASFSNPDAPQTPQIIEYNLNTQQADTFATKFDLSFVRIGLWLRYSPSGDRILYCNFPLGSFERVTNDDSEVGIIELPSRTRRVLDVNTNPEGERRSVQLAPTWSPEGEYIIYSSGALFLSSGNKGDYSLYLLKNVDDPLNYK